MFRCVHFATFEFNYPALELLILIVMNAWWFCWLCITFYLLVFMAVIAVYRAVQSWEEDVGTPQARDLFKECNSPIRWRRRVMDAPTSKERWWKMTQDFWFVRRCRWWCPKLQFLYHTSLFLWNTTHFRFSQSRNILIIHTIERTNKKED